MREVVVIFFSVLFLASHVSAQETVFEEGTTVYKQESTYGLVVHTTGWGVAYKYGKYIDGYSGLSYEGDLIGIKHPKEIKSYTSSFTSSNGYFFGKQNSLIVFRGGIGYYKTFVSKQSVRGVAISYSVSGGISLGYAKPVYLEVVKVDTSGFYTSRIEKYDPDIHSQGDILGKASWSRGFFGGKFYPGGYVKAGLIFDSSKQTNRINAIEVGAVLDAYLKKIPIMGNTFNRQFYFNLYVALVFGSKKS